MEHLTVPQFQKLVGQWAETTFPGSTPESIVKHLRREVDELLSSFTDGQPDSSEAGDCFILLAQLCHRMGWDLMAVSEAKHEVNLHRRWGTPDAEGVVEHLPCAECNDTGENLDPRIPATLCTACGGRSAG